MTSKEALEELVMWANNGYFAITEEREKEIVPIIEKDLDVLEIIKKKGIFVYLLKQSKNVEEYNSLMLIAFKKMAEKNYKCAVEKFCLTQEEYDLLKEALL